VDSIVKVAQQAMEPKALSKARADHQLVVAEASQARKAYLQQIAESVQYLRKHGIAGTAKQVPAFLPGGRCGFQSVPTSICGPWSLFGGGGGGCLRGGGWPPAGVGGSEI
jgi:hypothetical protein